MVPVCQSLQTTGELYPVFNLIPQSYTAYTYDTVVSQLKSYIWFCYPHTRLFSDSRYRNEILMIKSKPTKHIYLKMQYTVRFYNYGHYSKTTPKFMNQRQYGRKIVKNPFTLIKQYDVIRARCYLIGLLTFT